MVRVFLLELVSQNLHEVNSHPRARVLLTSSCTFLETAWTHMYTSPQRRWFFHLGTGEEGTLTPQIASGSPELPEADTFDEDGDSLPDAASTTRKKPLQRLCANCEPSSRATRTPHGSENRCHQKNSLNRSQEKIDKGGVDPLRWTFDP